MIDVVPCPFCSCKIRRQGRKTWEMRLSLRNHLMFCSREQEGEE